MSEATTTSRNAREALARALNALQSDPNTPPQLMELAAPIAQAMGALHNVEKTGQLAPHADVALNHVRTALQSLQQQPASHPAVAQAVEAVASSLGLVHNLWRMAQQPAAPAVPVAPPQPAVAFAATAVAPAPPMPPRPPPSVPRPAQPIAAGGAVPPPPAFVQQPTVPQPAFPQPQAAPPPVMQAPPPPPVMQAPPPPPVMQAPPPPVQHVAPPPPAPVAAPAYQAAPNFAAPSPGPSANSRAPGSPMAGNDLPLINADLGTHSPTNFYKGLSGNDIIDHGGLFVSTYMVPKIGTPVRLHVSLPGGYEFEANAVVSWSREAGDSSNDAPPGFGAKFTAITPEARQLVYRYVRNREPLFHDDL